MFPNSRIRFQLKSEFDMKIMGSFVSKNNFWKQFCITVVENSNQTGMIHPCFDIIDWNFETDFGVRGVLMWTVDCGLTFPCPPLALQPLGAFIDRKLAHSLKLAFPSIIAPTFLNFVTTPASRGTMDFSKANDPAVVLSLSLVAMLSLSRTGMPCSP